MDVTRRESYRAIIAFWAPIYSGRAGKGLHATEDILALIKSEKQALLERVEKEVKKMEGQNITVYVNVDDDPYNYKDVNLSRKDILAQLKQLKEDNAA